MWASDHHPFPLGRKDRTNAVVRSTGCTNSSAPFPEVSLLPTIPYEGVGKAALASHLAVLMEGMAPFGLVGSEALCYQQYCMLYMEGNVTISNGNRR